jgi:NAD(P)H-hydrate epimerase
MVETPKKTRTHHRLWDAATAARADLYTQEVVGIPSVVLMERAALACARVIVDRYFGAAPCCERVAILCGTGNNGGDGLALARILAHWQVPVSAYLVGGETPSLANQAQWARSYGASVHVGLADERVVADASALWVDALLGTGTRGAPRGEIREAIALLNRISAPIVSLDVPSGINPSTGEVPDLAVSAQVTVTFEASKPGLHLSPGRHCAGDVQVASIGLRLTQQAACGELLRTAGWSETLTSLHQAAHKGERGHVGLIGGDEGMEGAPMLAAMGAMRAGAGLVTIASTHRSSVYGPEVMHELLDPNRGVVERAKALVVGPGLHQAMARRAWLATLYGEDTRPMVWDASALDLLHFTESRPAGPRVITPHPGEAAALLNRLDSTTTWSSSTVQAHRRDAALRLAAVLDVVVVLKGSGTIIVEGDRLAICDRGSAALAVAGSGDVLSGLIGALLARGLPHFEAAALGVHIHAIAGESEDGALSGWSAGDIANRIPKAVRTIIADDDGPRMSWTLD